MEAFLLWFSGIAWGVKLFLAMYAGLHFVAFIAACIFAARTAEDEDDLAAKKKDALKIGKLFIFFATLAAVFPPESTWLGWLEFARRP